MEYRSFRFAAAATLVLALAVLCGAGVLDAQAKARPERAVEELNRPLRYQSSTDAILLVRPLLTASGTVTVEGKRLMVHDAPYVITRVGKALEDFDHPRVALRVIVQIVLANGETPARSQEFPEVPQPLLDRLRRTFRYGNYQMLARAGFEASEGTDLRSEVGQDFTVAFRLGTLRDGQLVRLHDFVLSRAESAESPMLDTNLVLSLDRPLAVGLTTDETSGKAMLVVLTCSRTAPPQ